MNLFDNIIKQVAKTNTITHILSYDLTGKDLAFYRELAELIQKEFPGAKKPLETFWEISTNESSEYIRNLVINKTGTSSKINVYKVQVLEKSTHPIIIEPRKPQ